MTYYEMAEKIRQGIVNPAWGEGISGEALYKELLEIEKEHPDDSRAMLKARMIAYVLRNAPVALTPGDLFADRLNHGGVMEAVRRKWMGELCATDPELSSVLEATREARACKALDGGLDTSHICPDWHRILTLGIPGMLEALYKAEKTPENRDFYASSALVWEAVGDFCRRLAFLCPGTPLESRLLHLTEAAPENLCEALELMLLVYLAQNELDASYVRSLGRLDKILLPYYQKEFSTDPENFKETIRFFYARISAMNHPNNLPFVLGGEGKEGKGGIHPLTRLLRDIYDEMGIFCPKLQIRVTKDTPADFIDDVFTSIRAGRSSYVFLNDAVVIPALEKLGIPYRDAVEYVPVGCYEPHAFGELPCTCAGTVNLLKAVELALNRGKDALTGKPIGLPAEEDYESYPAFEKAVLAQLEDMTRRVIEITGAYEVHYKEINPAPVFSATSASSVERGKDAYQGGILYNNTSVNYIGLANLVDSLCAVKAAVYDKKWVSLPQFREILQNNWEGYEALRHRLREETPHYGNGNPEADALAEKLVTLLRKRLNGVPNRRGGVYRTGLFSIDWVYAYGKGTGASPDGRLAGEPLAKNLCAVMGTDKKGVTALCNAAGPLGKDIPNGAVLDLMLHPTAVEGEAGLQALQALLLGYMAKGGEALQMNVMDAATLRAAQEKPESYSTLQVRVCGWNALFTRLSKEEQDVFIAQAELL